MKTQPKGYCYAQMLSPVQLCDHVDCNPPGSSVPWNSPGKNIRVGCHFLLQGIFLTQGSHPPLLHRLLWQTDAFPQCHLGSLLKSFGVSDISLSDIIVLRQYQEYIDVLKINGNSTGRSPGEENGYLLEYSCLENLMDRGAWQATVHGVGKSWT